MIKNLTPYEMLKPNLFPFFNINFGNKKEARLGSLLGAS
jgi:hypothetical protein